MSRPEAPKRGTSIGPVIRQRPARNHSTRPSSSLPQSGGENAESIFELPRLDHASVGYLMHVSGRKISNLRRRDAQERRTLRFGANDGVAAVEGHDHLLSACADREYRLNLLTIEANPVRPGRSPGKREVDPFGTRTVFSKLTEPESSTANNARTNDVAMRRQPLESKPRQVVETGVAARVLGEEPRSDEHATTTVSTRLRAEG